MFNKGNMSKMFKHEQPMQEDVIITTVNKTLRKAQDEAQSRMSAVTGNMLGGLNMLGM